MMSSSGNKSKRAFSIIEADYKESIEFLKKFESTQPVSENFPITPPSPIVDSEDGNTPECSRIAIPMTEESLEGVKRVTCESSQPVSENFPITPPPQLSSTVVTIVDSEDENCTPGCSGDAGPVPMPDESLRVSVESRQPVSDNFPKTPPPPIVDCEACNNPECNRDAVPEPPRFYTTTKPTTPPISPTPSTSSTIYWQSTPQPRPRKRKSRKMFEEYFVRCEENEREARRERERFFAKFEQEKIRQKDIELRQRDTDLELQAQRLELMKEALKVLEKYFSDKQK